MDRRKFLRNTSLAGTAITAASLVSWNSDSNIADNFKDDFELNEITIDELQNKMKQGAYTSRSITEKYLKRINDIDKNGVMLNAVIELNPDALTIADERDRERKAGKIRGPLHGIPMLVKDNVNTGDKMMTTAGALALEGNHASQDAFIIQLLREAGAVLLGKTNLSEWANFRSTRSTSGWSSRGGQTKSPTILDRNPSGSSSGTGSAVAANLCVIGIGTETDGSVVSPSSVNGIVGIKPTVGLWSRSGIIPISKTQDTAGPMARTVRDAAILLGALAGVDTNDEITNESIGKSYKDYTQFLDVNALKGKRIGVEKSFLKGHEGVVGLLKDAIEVLKKQGAEVVEIDLLSKMKDSGDAEYQVLLYEFKDGVNKYLSTANAKVKTVADVIEWNKQNEKKAMPYFKQEILEQANAKGDLNSKEYLDALSKSTSSREIIDNIIKQNKLDAITGTTNGLACCIDLANGDYDTGFSFSSPAAKAGYPHITVPMGSLYDLPVGLSFFASKYEEPKIIAIAYAYEQASKKRVSPAFKKNFVM